MSESENLRKSQASLGLWCQTGHATVVDAAASAQPDWICVDTQHGVDLGRVDSSLFTVMASYGVASLVRVPAIEVAPIGRALDLGANGIVVPLVETVDDAQLAVAATRHAPRGSRSFGMQTNRVGPFDEQPFLVIQIETYDAMANLSNIAAVEGVDALYIGPADLGLALAGKAAPNVDEIFDGLHPAVIDACEKVVTAANGAGIVAGLHCNSGEQAKRAAEFGFRMMAVASDVGSVEATVRSEMDSARS